MAKVMLREKEGKTLFYAAKKDMEETIASIEFDTVEKWGGETKLTNGGGMLNKKRDNHILRMFALLARNIS